MFPNLIFFASEDFIEVDAKYEHPRRFAARVVGDSCEPALSHGDMTIWHSDKSPAAGLLVLAQQQHGELGVTVKVLQFDPESGGPVLIAPNEMMKAPDNGDGWTIQAKLVAVERVIGGTTQSWFNREGLRPRDLQR